jgi:hypothetical protein
MLLSRVVKVVPVALTLVGCGLAISPATAQTTYPFEANYNGEIIVKPLGGNFSKTDETGESVDAQYGLTNLTNVAYAELDPNTSIFKFDSDPAVLGLEGLPVGEFNFFGSGSNQLFATISGTVQADFENLVGAGSSTITITGGEGIFSGATGTLRLLENDTFSPDPTAPINVRFAISGLIETPTPVPEPQTDSTLIAIGAIGFGVLLRRHRHRTKV